MVTLPPELPTEANPIEELLYFSYFVGSEKETRPHHHEGLTLKEFKQKHLKKPHNTEGIKLTGRGKLRCQGRLLPYYNKNVPISPIHSPPLASMLPVLTSEIYYVHWRLMTQ